MTLGDERPVVDLLGGGDAGAQDLDGPVVLPLEVGDERGEHERHLAPENGVAGVRREALRFGEPRCASAARPCRWSMSPSRSNASHSTSVRSKREAASATSTSSSHASLSRPSIIMMSARRRRRSSCTSGMLVPKHVERPRVVPLCLMEAFPPFGAAGGIRERSGRLQQRRLDRAAGHLAGEAARLLEVPRDDLDELVGASRQDRHPVGEADVELRPSALRDLSIRDVPHQDVLERVLVLAGDGRDLAVEDEVPALERLQARVEIGGESPFVGAEVRDRTRPEDRADDGRVVRQVFVASFEPVEPRADQALDACRDR